MFTCISVLSETYNRQEVDIRQTSGILQTTEATSVMHCAILCTSQELCLGINIRLPSEEQTSTLCNLLSNIAAEEASSSGETGSEEAWSEAAGWSLYRVIRE